MLARWVLCPLNQVFIPLFPFFKEWGWSGEANQGYPTTVQQNQGSRLVCYSKASCCPPRAL
jgi:hypothetical protein